MSAVRLKYAVAQSFGISGMTWAYIPGQGSQSQLQQAGCAAPQCFWHLA
jgi:hypothetical protein